MQQQFEGMEIQLWEYLDGICSEADRQCIAQLISSNEVWKKKYAELKALQDELVSMETEHPSMRFTANVMDNIAGAKVAGKTTRYLNNWVVKGIAAFFLIILGSVIMYSIVAVDWTSSNIGTFSLGKLVDDDMMKVVMFINVILALMLLDKVLNRQRAEKASV